MYAPLKEIITSLLKHDMASDEALLVLCITRADTLFWIRSELRPARPVAYAVPLL
ncbi:hypothetical protein G3601_003870 [Salmonella enterica]|nr:hypothetical protein [Salmonella enterica]EIS5513328.1 hypothetical protein [Salmonella enterica]